MVKGDGFLIYPNKRHGEFNQYPLYHIRWAFLSKPSSSSCNCLKSLVFADLLTKTMIFTGGLKRGKKSRKISRKRRFMRLRAVAFLSYARPTTTVARETGLLVNVHFIRKNGPLGPRPLCATNFAAPVGRRFSLENITKQQARQ